MKKKCVRAESYQGDKSGALSRNCDRKWTRRSGREKSIIDYIMIGEKVENGVESIIIDEKKEKSPYRMRRSDGITHQIFPCHNVMI